MLPLIIMAACGAAGAVASAVTTHAVHEKDRQAAKRYEKVNTELINSRNKLQKQYYEISDRSKQQINDLNLKLAESEMEKDVVYLALELYQELMGLREDIDINPSFEVLVEFHKAIVLTNYVLQQLDKRLVPVTQEYFSRTLNRIDQRDNLSKEQLFNFMAMLMNPQQDTVTSLLGEIQNEMFAQPTRETEESDAKLLEAQLVQDRNPEDLEDFLKCDKVDVFSKDKKLEITETVIEILDNVPGMTPCRASLFGRSTPKFTLKNGTVIRTWTNRMVGGDHVFLADSDGTMLFGGFVWAHAQELKQAIRKIRKQFA